MSLQNEINQHVEEAQIRENLSRVAARLVQRSRALRIDPENMAGREIVTVHKDDDAIIFITIDGGYCYLHADESSWERTYPVVQSRLLTAVQLSAYGLITEEEIEEYNTAKEAVAVLGRAQATENTIRAFIERHPKDVILKYLQEG